MNAARIVVLDTETTGLDVAHGHRVIEIGCIELLARRPSGRNFHRYLNPQRAVDAGALAVHGLDNAFLSTQPCFAEVATELLEFLGDAELVAHNAVFDIGFLDAELARVDATLTTLTQRHVVTDTLALARERFPGQRNSLDALCKRFEVDNSGRTLHGALLDAELLAEVYLAMTAGQGALAFESAATDPSPRAQAVRPIAATPARRPRVLQAGTEERAAHEQRLDAIERTAKRCAIWREIESGVE